MTEMSNFPTPLICNGCGEAIIVDMDFNSIHIHHDSNKCDWVPSSMLLMRAMTIEEEKSEILLHEILCDHKVYYHEACCRKCGFTLAGV